MIFNRGKYFFNLADKRSKATSSQSCLPSGLFNTFQSVFQIRQIKYFNNIIEPDHRGIKHIVKPMMGFKAFHSAEATLAGMELCRMLKKGQLLMLRTHLHLSNFMR